MHLSPTMRYRLDNEKEEEEDRRKPVVDPVYELSSEDTLRLGYEWILNSDESLNYEYENNRPGQRQQFRGYSISGNTDYYDYFVESPMQSNVDFLRRAPYEEAEFPRHHSMRAFDFNKSLREVGDVRLLLGGQTPHWIGTPHFSLDKATLLANLASPMTSELSLPSVRGSRLELGGGSNAEARPPSPDSFTVTEEDPRASVLTVQSSKISAFNPWGLVGDDYEEKTRTTRIDEPAESSDDTVGQDYEEQTTRQPTPLTTYPSQDEPQYGHRGEPSYPEETRQMYHDQYDPHWHSRGGAQQPYSTDPRDVYNRGRGQPNTSLDRVPSYFQPQESTSRGVRREATILEEAIQRQISELHRQLDAAYSQLEHSEYEKRRLVQQLSYLRLMELELEELQALNRIIAADVPEEEDIQILDRIIYKIRGPRFPH